MKPKIRNICIMGIKAIVFSGFVLIISNCSKELLDIRPEIKDQIIGDWAWLKTIWAKSQQVISPSTEGYTIMARFKTNDSVYYYKDNTLTKAYKYEFKYRVNDPLDDNSDSTLFFEIGQGGYVLCDINNDTLIISTAYKGSPYIEGSINFYNKLE
jgi:hypothetical protein